MNQVTLYGNIGRIEDLRYTGTGKAVINLSIATNEDFYANGEKKKKTEWHNLVAWGNIAEVLAKMKKGDSLLVIGKNQTSSWDAKDGSKRYKTEVVVLHAGLPLSETHKNERSETHGRGQMQDPQTDAPAAEPDNDLPF